LVFDSTGLFTRGDILPKIGHLSGASSFTFGRKVGDISDVLDGEGGYYILGLRERTKRGVQPLSAVRDRIVASLMDTLAAAAAREYAQGIRERVVGGATLDEVREGSERVVAGLAEDVAANAFVPQLGNATRAAAVALALPEGAVSGVLGDSVSANVVRVVRRAERAVFDPSSSQAVHSRQAMQGRGQQMAYADWFRSVYANARIVSHIDRFYMD
jgi:hypothetical protein